MFQQRDLPVKFGPVEYLTGCSKIKAELWRKSFTPLTHLRHFTQLTACSSHTLKEPESLPSHVYLRKLCLAFGESWLPKLPKLDAMLELTRRFSEQTLN